MSAMPSMATEIYASQRTDAMFQKETSRGLLDHLVGKREQIWGEREAKLFCRLLVDDQLKFCGLHDRDIGRFGTLQALGPR